MRVLVIQHDHDKPLGRLEQPLRDEGLELDIRQAGRDPVELAEHVALIALSGFADPVDETATVAATREAFATALEDGLPALGVCLGAQLLAQAAGAVAGECRDEYGYAPIELTRDAADDPLFAGLPDRLEVFHAHSYAVSLPPAATALARTEHALQAFHLPPAAWGLQFHPEPTVEIVEGWVVEHSDFLRAHDADPARVAADARRLDATARHVAETIVTGFAGRVRERQAARA
jgi:GMP synthase-like glutamine amidotransferase